MDIIYALKQILHYIHISLLYIYIHILSLLETAYRLKLPTFQASDYHRCTYAIETPLAISRVLNDHQEAINELTIGATNRIVIGSYTNPIELGNSKVTIEIP